MENDDFSQAGLGVLVFFVAIMCIVGGIGMFVLGLVI